MRGRRSHLTPAIIRSAHGNVVRSLDGWPTAHQLLAAHQRIAAYG